MNDNLEIRSLAEAEVHLQQLELFFQNQLLRIRAVRSEAQAQQNPPVERDYKGWKLRDAMRDFLDRANIEVNEEALAKSLEELNCDMGANPTKNVRIAVSMNSGTFYRNSGRVGLMLWRKQQKVA